MLSLHEVNLLEQEVRADKVKGLVLSLIGMSREMRKLLEEVQSYMKPNGPSRSTGMHEDLLSRINWLLQETGTKRSC